MIWKLLKNAKKKEVFLLEEEVK